LQHIIANARDHLVAGGWLVLEHGDTQGDSVRRLLEATGFVGVRTWRDLAGRERCTEGRLGPASD
jgi:release factor glutamine methyltransferase